MREVRHKLALDRPATHQIRVPGKLDESWADWAGSMTIRFESEGEGPPVTTLIGTVDQVVLQSVLCRLFFLRLPLISVNCVACGSQDWR